MPSFSPIKRQLFRSSGVPCSRRGYQARGTEIVRPSFTSTARVSSVTITFWAFASAVKILIPTPQHVCSIFFNQSLDTVDLNSTKASAILQSYGFQPEFGLIVVPFDMNMRRLVTISRIKE